MKPNQTSVRGNIQDVLCPMSVLNVTQGDFEGNHPFYASDLAGADTGRDLYYAPCDVVCVATNPSDGNAVWWQSVDKVRHANGTIDYLTQMILHDNNLDGIYVGVVYKQGQQIAQEGKTGYATGNHLHVEFAVGKFTKRYEKNDKGYYLPNGVAIEDVCFIDNTTLKGSCANWNWKYTNDVPVVEAPKGQTVTLPANATSWRVYPTDKAPVIGNESGKLNPSLFGGITYDIIGDPQPNVVTIKTRDFGTVNIFVGDGTGAIIE